LKANVVRNWKKIPTHKEIAREKKDDMILSEYIKSHGVGGWRSLSKKVGEPLSLLLE
jgi:hypothetical protein